MSKAAVLKRVPDAFSYEWRDEWVIYKPMGKGLSGNQMIGIGSTAARAWKDAARRLTSPQPAEPQ